MRNWQPLLRRVNSRTSKGSMSLLQQRGLSVTEVVVEVGGNVLLDTERCPSELIIICAPSTPRFHIRKLQHEASLSHRPHKKARQADCVNGYTPARPSPHFLANCSAICFQYFPVFSGLFGPKENCYLISFSSQITSREGGEKAGGTKTANQRGQVPGSQGTSRL